MSTPLKYTTDHHGEVDHKELKGAQVVHLGDDRYKVLHNGQNYTIRLISLCPEKNTFEFAIDGIKVQGKGHTSLDMLIAELGFNENAEASVKEIMAPMPGLVLRIEVKEGDEVEEGDSLLVLEAMKMENIIKSPGAGVVKTIVVNPSDAVDKNQLLVEFE